jgi:hypothetical protein
LLSILQCVKRSAMITLQELLAWPQTAVTVDWIGVECQGMSTHWWARTLHLQGSNLLPSLSIQNGTSMGITTVVWGLGTCWLHAMSWGRSRILNKGGMRTWALFALKLQIPKFHSQHHFKEACSTSPRTHSTSINYNNCVII